MCTVLTSNLASPRAGTAQVGGSIIGGGAGIFSDCAETCRGRHNLIEDVPTEEVVRQFEFKKGGFELVGGTSRSCFLEQKFICDRGIEPQSDTFTVIFILVAMMD